VALRRLRQKAWTTPKARIFTSPLLVRE